MPSRSEGATRVTARPSPPAAPERLRRSEDIRAVLGRRRGRSGACMVVHARWRGDAQPPRATVVAGRKLGGAVQRNRAKRRLRAALREVGAPCGADIVLVARPGALTAPFGRLKEELATLVGENVGRGRTQH